MPSKHPLQKISHLLLLSTLLLATSSCSREKAPLDFTFKLRDDYVTIIVPESERTQFTKIITLSRERIEEVSAIFDDKNPHSEISRINRLSERVRFPISFEMSRILRFAKTYYKQSESVFDISIFPLAHMWGFHGGIPPGKVSRDVIAASVTSVGLDHIGIYDGAIELNSPFSRIDLSGLLEGYLIDLAILRLRNNNYQHAFIQYGNSMRSLGTNTDGKKWRVDIPHPYKTNNIIGQLTLDNNTAASYSYIHAKSINNEGQKITHILDPRTGQPSDHTLYTLAIGPTGHMTDALSTTLTIQGLQGAPTMFKNFDQRCNALLIPNKKPLEIWVSDNMLDHFTPTAAYKDLIQTIPTYSPKNLEKAPNTTLENILNDGKKENNKYIPIPKKLQN